MEKDRKIELDVFAAANIMGYAGAIEYNSIISALAGLVGIFKENHLGKGNEEIDVEEFNYILCSIIEYCSSVEVFKSEVEYAFKDKDLTPYHI